MQLSHFPYAYFAFSRTLVSFYTCYYINFVFISALDFSTLLMFFIALDRFISAKFPYYYSNIRKGYYIASVVFACLVYVVIFKVLLFTSLTNELTLCLIAESMTGAMTNVWFGVSTIVNLGVIGLYFSLTRMLRGTYKNFWLHLSALIVSLSEYHRINRSLNTQILVYIFGWLCTMAGCSFALLASPKYALLLNISIRKTRFSHRVYTAIETTVGIACNVNLAAPFFVYFFRSTLYRQEFNRLFGIRTAAVYTDSTRQPNQGTSAIKSCQQTSEA
ncbi:hypothetical protein L596_014101 [Steinernema carpocapsae]|uniref:G-protein coupled receptors family 1 profile domain-containing protein n=2 Tax=Steinernema carpocapsae TaxID=34508 RepID=A0A4U5NAN4_STECR|nr:hypothetical protein L596_014101 [Steinernema carpocapsae]